MNSASDHSHGLHGARASHDHDDHDDQDHHHGHHHSHILTSGMLTAGEKRTASIQLALAMAALSLLTLGLAWRWLFPAEESVGQLLLAAASLIVAVPVIRSAWHALRYPSLHGVTDQLIALAMLAAWATGDLLTAALLPIVMIFGHVLEERSVIGSKEAMEALARLTDSQARLIEADGAVREVSNAALKRGDVVEVRAGDRIPADGLVIEGQASLDTAPITGESVPVEVAGGMSVFGGAINLDGLLRIEITKIGDESTLGKVIALMQRAENSKPPIVRMLERYAQQYLGFVLTLAAIAWFVTYDDQIMLAVLVAACPCALVLSAPATAVAGIAVAARHGILIRSSAFLEELADLGSLIIDKTGTLTVGRLRLQEIALTGAVDRETALRLAASLGSASSHPVSQALAAQVPRKDHDPLLDITEHQGLGVVATTSAGKVALGRPELFRQLAVATPPVPAHDGPIAGLSVGGRFAGWLLLADTTRPEAAIAMAELRALGLHRQILLTGDRRPVADDVAREVGIEHVVAQALPADKLDLVLRETESGVRPLVVGDGINDSLALKAGAVGVAMGASGADIALASADIILIGSDLRRLATCIRLSRRCRQTLQVNVVIGLGWTVMIVTLAGLGWLGAAGAVIAAVLHNVSTLLVLANTGRLLRFDEVLGLPDEQPGSREMTANAAISSAP